MDRSKVDTAKIDALLKGLHDREVFNGALLAADSGGIRYAGAHGLADFNTGSKLDADSVFELASLSKPLTAAGVMLLREQGLIAYDEPVTQWMPELPYPGISVRHLLQHTSGLPDYMALFMAHWDPAVIAVNQDVLDMLVRHRPEALFAPGEHWSYSNTGYVMLALLIERASGLPFASFMDRYLFKPLGMSRTSIHNRRKQPTTIDNYAYGYVYDTDLQQYRLPDDVAGLELVVFLDGIQGDGTVNATLLDLYRFDQAIRSGSLLPPAAWAEAFEPARLNGGETFGYGFGWILGDSEDTGPWSAHNGGWPGYSTCMYRFDNGGQTIIILSNTDKDGELLPLIVEAVHAILNGKPYRIPEPPAERSIPED